MEFKLSYPVFFVAGRLTQRLGDGFFFDALVTVLNEAVPGVEGRSVLIFTTREGADACCERTPGTNVFEVYVPSILAEYAYASQRLGVTYARFLRDHADPGIHMSLSDLIARARG